VVDALDEAATPDDLMSMLLLELAALSGDDGRPACRLLVGTRKWPEFAPLLDAAVTDGQMCDLDAVPPEQLQADLAEYVHALLWASFTYGGVGARALRRRLAAKVADAVGACRREGAAGSFLVAGLYAHHLASSGMVTHDLSRIDEEVPHTLGEVLELHLAQFAADAWLRPVLVALASAKDTGMPVRLLGNVAAQFRMGPDGTPAEPPETWRVEDVLDKVRFYLRRSVGTDGQAQYRLFHQGLADHLRQHPRTPPGESA
jgi:hypothetical protein